METLTLAVCVDEALAREDDGADFAAGIARVVAPMVRDGNVELMATMVVCTQAAGRGNAKLEYFVRTGSKTPSEQKRRAPQSIVKDGGLGNKFSRSVQLDFKVALRQNG